MTVSALVQTHRSCVTAMRSVVAASIRASTMQTLSRVRYHGTTSRQSTIVSRRSSDLLSEVSNSSSQLSLDEVLALTSAGEKSVGSTLVDSSVEEQVRAVMDLLAEGRKPIETFQALHGPRTFLSHALSAAALAEEAGADRDTVLTALLCNTGHLVGEWDYDCPHMVAAMHIYGDRFLNKNGIAFHVRRPIRLQTEVQRYFNTKKADASMNSQDFGYSEELDWAAEQRGFQSGGASATMSAGELETFESGIFTEPAIMLFKWSEDVFLRGCEFTRQEQEVLLKKYESMIRGHIFDTGHGKVELFWKSRRQLL